MNHVFIIGGTTFDHIVTLPVFPDAVPQTIHNAPFFETTGSTGSGKALSLTKLSVPNSFYSVLGDDSYGHHIIQHLGEAGVNFFYDFDPKGTERHINIMNADGGRISMFVTQSSEKPKMNLTEIELQLAKADVVVLNIISYCKTLVPLVEKSNKPVWTDLHDYTDRNSYHEPFIEVSDYIFLSSDNLPDYKTTMLELMKRGKELIVCTHGKNGATALTKDGKWHDEPALTDYKLVDSNGAGDNFFSGFLFAFLKEKPIADCLRFGTICGAECVTSKQLVNEHLSANLLQTKFESLFRHN